jgi:hypothetical protein
MNITPELCVETLISLKRELQWKPRVAEIIDRRIDSINKKITDPYTQFKECLITLREIVGERILQHAIMKPKDEAKKDFKLFINGTPHGEKCNDRFCTERECVLKREVKNHLIMKSEQKLNCGKLCSTCFLLKDLELYQKKKLILKARYGMGDSRLVDLVSHCRNCQHAKCQQSYLSYSCKQVKCFLAHEVNCYDPDCTCFYIEPLLRYVDKHRDDEIIDPPSIEEMSDCLFQTGIDESEMKLESIMFRDDFVVEPRRQIRPVEKITPEMIYVWSFGIDEPMALD